MLVRWVQIIMSYPEFIYYYKFKKWKCIQRLLILIELFLLIAIMCQTCGGFG